MTGARGSSRRRHKRHKVVLPHTVSESIWGHVLGLRNGVQDLATVLFIGSEKDPAKREAAGQSPQMLAFRRQCHNMSQHAITEICKDLRQLNATAPCGRCSATGKLQELMGPQKVCPVCKGTGWEPLV